MLIPFEPPQLSPQQIGDTDLLDNCKDAGDAVPTSFDWKNSLKKHIGLQLTGRFLKNKINVRISPTYTILTTPVYPEGKKR